MTDGKTTPPPVHPDSDPGAVANPHNPTPEIRFALAMNGGVSLAVWIGGVCDELLRLCTADVDLDAPAPSAAWSPYQLVTWAARLQPRVDVMAGASAGGLNGVFLALALVYGHSDLSDLRELWITSGSFKQLLRDPLDQAPPSLLRGDDYFLPELEQAVDRLINRTPQSPYQVPIDLMLTVTSMSGIPMTYANTFGGTVTERKHDLLLRFRHRFPSQDGTVPGSDFTPDRPLPGETDEQTRTRVVSRLARACRSTASFPGAFEPSLVRVTTSPSTEDPRDTMLPHQANFPKSAFCIDGGTLVNLPVGEALDAIFEQPARGPVRRVFAMVVPDPSLAPADAIDGGDREPPSLTAVVGSALSTLPRNQTVGRFLTELQQRNADLEAVRASRDELLRPEEDDKLIAHARRFITPYAASRHTASDRTIARHLEAELNRRKIGDERRQEWRAVLPRMRPPWIPSSFETDDEHLARWGTSTVRRNAARVLHVLDRVDPTPEIRADVQQAVQRALASVGAAASSTERNLFATAPLEASPTDAHIETLTAHWAASMTGSADAERFLGSALETIRPSAVGHGVELLLALEVIESTFGGFGSGVEQTVETVRIDTIVTSPLEMGRGRGSATGKIAGVQLGHFGAFLRASWRANDWMWGRLDGSNNLIDIMLSQADPDRIRAVAAVLEVAPDQLKQQLKERWHAEIVIEETPAVVAALADDEKAGGATLPAARRLVEHWNQAEDRPALTGAGAERTADRIALARELLDANRIGAETFADHAGSDLMTETSITALATGSTVLHGGGPKVLKSSIAVLRYVALMAWGLLKGALGGPAGRVIGGVAFGFGAAVVAIDVFTGQRIFDPIFSIGVVVFVAGLLILYARAPFVLYPLLLLGALPIALAKLPSDPWSWWPSDWPWQSLRDEWTYIPAVTFVVAVLLIGYVRRPVWMQSTRSATRAGEARLSELAGGPTTEPPA